MLAYLLDTDWMIDYLTGRGGTLPGFDDLDPTTFALSIVSVAELLDGLAGSRDQAADRDRLDQMLGFVTILEIDRAVAELFGDLRSHLRRSGMLIPDLDLLIAATALRHDLTLVTRNRRHFGRVPGLRLHEVASP